MKRIIYIFFLLFIWFGKIQANEDTVVVKLPTGIIYRGFTGHEHLPQFDLIPNPEVAPYYGEIPYSGRQVTLGYYGNNTNNAIFANYPYSAIYGSINIR
ncbi:MAG: hypothetical protein JST67_05735 [Bacteroidetes bacterium]|nr:hypothetical protein [Bacteroidota bacterium]